MGLMSWLRGGGRKGTDTSTGTSAGAGTGMGGDSEDSASFAVPRERVDLAELPPIQRTLGAQDLVIDPSGFQGSLSTRQDPALGTPLGHLVSPDAPTGLVHGLTAPAAPVAADRPSPVQRSAERAQGLPGGARSVPLPSPRSLPPSVAVQRVVPGGASAMTSAGESAMAELPVRQLVGEQPLVTAAESAAPGPATPPSSLFPNPSQQPPSSAAPPVQRSVMPPAPGSPRRAPGLGAPMSALPPTAQRQAAVDGPGRESGAVPVARSAADAGDGAARTPAVPEPGPEPESGGPTAPLLGDSPLLPAASDPAPPAPTPAVQRTPAVPSPSPMAPPPSTDPVAPLLADRPVPLQNARNGDWGAAVQRSATDDGAGGAAPPPPAGTGTMPGPVPGSASPADAVPVRWTAGGEGTASMAAVTPSVPAALQRTVAAPGQGTGAPPPSPPLPALQRRVAGGPPVPRSLTGGHGGSAAPAFTSAGSVAVAAGVAQRAADGSVVFGAPPPAYSAPVVQRETETEEPPPPDPPQDPDPDPGPEPDPAPGPAADDRDASGTTAPGGPPGQGGREGGAPVVTDELVRALYPPLSRLFKADLRLERERAGFLINTRH
ncbi:hypothetical protein [Streptomyces sp. NPDC014685]|uniref:hypothetical protein n=1 Tax=Streptomyces sp. NPDC014685 TaxID=3364881 RepID=UPI0036FC28A6